MGASVDVSRSTGAARHLHDFVGLHGLALVPMSDSSGL
jgi:hypothetical protein